jgi:DNA polymerase (family 10)
MEAFRTMPGVQKVLATGDTKTSVRLIVDPNQGRWKLEGGEGRELEGPSTQCDLRVVPEACFGAALLYFTGSKEHNVRLRQRALERGLTLNEYGLFPEDPSTDTPPQDRGIAPVACDTEDSIYAHLGLHPIPPELREDKGELDRYEQNPGERSPGGHAGALPASPARPGTRKPPAAKPTPSPPHPATPPPPPLITVEDIRAELHAHTTASDGTHTILALAQEAKARGFHTIAVTDHSKSSAIAGGLPIPRLLEHIAAIREAQRHIDGITILAGSEVDILADGTLDYPDDVLAQLDIVVASPHASLGQDPAAATARLVRAVSNPFVRILGHPTGRLINRRPGLSPDMAAVIAAAKANNVALEINAHWMRLDLRDTHVRQALDADALIAIDCDVHEPADFDNLRYGVITGRRGGITPDRCINTWPTDRLHAWLKRPAAP